MSNLHVLTDEQNENKKKTKEQAQGAALRNVTQKRMERGSERDITGEG